MNTTAQANTKAPEKMSNKKIFAISCALALYVVAFHGIKHVFTYDAARQAYMDNPSDATAAAWVRSMNR